MLRMKMRNATYDIEKVGHSKLSLSREGQTNHSATDIHSASSLAGIQGGNTRLKETVLSEKNHISVSTSFPNSHLNTFTSKP
jgi:hypothetical protein